MKVMKVRLRVDLSIIILFLFAFSYLFHVKEISSIEKSYAASIMEIEELIKIEHAERVKTLSDSHAKEKAEYEERLKKKNVSLEELKLLQTTELSTVNNSMSKAELIRIINVLSNDTKNINITQGYNKKRLEAIVRKTLIFLDEKHVEDYTSLILLTAQVESDLGYYTSSLSGEDAHGIFQIQSITENDILTIFLPRNKNLQSKVLLMRGENLGSIKELEINLVYSIAICYCIYKWRLKDKNPPSKNDKMAQAEIYKNLFNTIYGSSSIIGTLKKSKGI